MTQIEQLSKNASLQKLARDWKKLSDLGHSVCDSKIKLVNLGREIGIGLQTICQHEQMSLSYFETIRTQLPEGFTYTAVQKCIHIANALPEPAKTIEQANHVEAQTMLALGLIEQPHRTAIQNRHESTPDTAIFMALASAKDKLFKQLETSKDWTASTKESVRIQVEKFEAVIAQIKTRLV
jgi:hypothetical protein